MIRTSALSWNYHNEYCCKLNNYDIKTITLGLNRLEHVANEVVAKDMLELVDNGVSTHNS